MSIELQIVNFKHFAGGKGSENLKVFNLESDLWKIGTQAELNSSRLIVSRKLKYPIIFIEKA